MKRRLVIADCIVVFVDFVLCSITSESVMLFISLLIIRTWKVIVNESYCNIINN